jgi:putative ABC transport system permease protein
MIWLPRIKFGGLLDIPDERGETRSQGPMTGLAVDLLSADSAERTVLHLDKALVRGRLPERPGEVLISDLFARRLEVNPGETATLIGSTMDGAMAIHNFQVAGTVRFGITALDRGAMLADIGDVRAALDMDNAVGEVLGLYRSGLYSIPRATRRAAAFNQKFQDREDEFLPLMVPLHDQNDLKGMLDIFAAFSGVISFIFIAVMSIVLWNAGLMGSLRRFGEIGVRLAIGESRGHLYRSLIAESMMIGLIGTVLGTGLGLAGAYFLQIHGINIGSMMKNANVMMTEVMRAQVTPVSYVIGFFPGLAATFLGTAFSGIGVYRRKTSQLMKELEA